MTPAPSPDSPVWDLISLHWTSGLVARVGHTHSQPARSLIPQERPGPKAARTAFSTRAHSVRMTRWDAAFGTSSLNFSAVMGFHSSRAYSSRPSPEPQGKLQVWEPNSDLNHHSGQSRPLSQVPRPTRSLDGGRGPSDGALHCHQYTSETFLHAVPKRPAATG